MAQTSSGTRQDTSAPPSRDGWTATGADPLYLELPLKNGTSIFIPVSEVCEPTD